MHSFAVIIELHIECLDVLGIVIEDNWPVEDLLSEMSFVLGSEINTPVELVFKLYLALLDLFLEDGNTLSVSNSLEGSIDNLLDALNETLFNELIEELELLHVVS